MKKALFTILALLVFQFGQAQTIDSLQGTWNLKHVYSTKGKATDSAGSEKVIRMLRKPYITFNEEDLGKIKPMGKAEDMSYSYNKKRKKIIIVSESGVTYVLKIETFTADQIKGEYMGMEVLFTKNTTKE